MKRALMLTVLLLVLVASSALADREITIRPVSDLEVQQLLPATRQDCQVGNTAAAFSAIPGFITPPEEYKLVFDPLATCGACPLGFQITTIRVFLQVDQACDIIMGVDVEEVTYPNSPDCPEPGPIVCEAGLFLVSLPDAGLWNIGLPITCECADLGYLYLLGVFIESTTCDPVPDLVVTEGPANFCTNWLTADGAVWNDLAEDPDWPGDLKFFAEADCCSPPVANESRTWGGIKGMYR